MDSIDQQIDFDRLRDRRAEIGAARTSIQPWARGKRPQAKFIPKIARVLNISLVAAVKALWKENIGELCLCGCGGKTVFPHEFPTARQLVLALPCARCGKKRIFSVSQHEDHRRFCQKWRMPANRHNLPRLCDSSVFLKAASTHG